MSIKRARFSALRMRREGRGVAQLEVSVPHSGSCASPSFTPSPTTPTVTECQSELWADTPEMDSELDLDQSFTEHPSDGDYAQSPVKRPKRALMPLGNKVFIAQSSMFDDFIKQINRTSQCKTKGCCGKLVLAGIRTVGLGGAILLKFGCSGCENRPLVFQSSALLEQTQRTLIGFAMQVAFVAGGCMHSQYQRVLVSLGMNCFNHQTFDETIKRISKPVLELLREQCTEAKDDMRALPPTQLGSWERAVTVSDGTWLTRGHHSRNHTYSLRNFMNNSLLYFKHFCMQGYDTDAPYLDKDDQDLYQGTAKAAEGLAAEHVFALAKQDTMHIVVHWQDADSTSEKAFRVHYPERPKKAENPEKPKKPEKPEIDGSTDKPKEESIVMRCAGHAVRSHMKALDAFKTMKKFTPRFCQLHEKDFPDMAKVRCHCRNNHSPHCGCLIPKFLVQARKNFNCCLKQAGKCAASFAVGMLTLGKYHARDIHQWESKPYKICTCGKCEDEITCEGKLLPSECGFHPERKCTCGECGKNETKCDGEPYHSKHPLTCPFHALAYEIECTTRALQAHKLVHPELGSATSNILEASHNVFIRYRPKSISLSRVHYMVSTNLGLLQSNLSYMIEKHGVKYHWLLDLFTRLKLPIFDGMKEGLEKANRDRMHRLAFKKTERAKKRRIEHVQSRDKEQKARSKWGKKQKIQHDYGTDIMVEKTHDSKGPAGQKRCKCNSTSHLRTNHSECPLNPKRKRNTSAVSSHTVSCDREETSPTRVTSPPQDEDSSESDQEETSPTRGMSPPPSEASSDLECMDTSDVCDSESENSSDSPNQTLNQTLKWRSSVSPKHCLLHLCCL